MKKFHQQKNHLEDFITYAYQKLFDTSKTRQIDKFSRLQEKIVGFRTEEQKYDSDSIKGRWVVNISSQQLILAAISLLQ